MAFSISGLSGSGLDVTQIVQDLMNVERIPYSKLETKRSQLQTEQSVFRSLNTKLKTLETSLFNLKFSNNLDAYKATTSSNSITASATDTAIPGSYKIKVTQASKAATSTVSGLDLLEAIKNGDFKIGDLDFSKANPKDPNSAKDDSFIDSLGFDKYSLGDDSNHEQLLRSVISYINSNSTSARSSLSMIKLDNGTFSVKFTSNSSADVPIISTTYLNETKQITTDGQKAEFSVNGNPFSSESNKLDNIIPGVTFTIREDITLNAEETITVSTDTDKVIDKIKSFVTAYNDLIDMVRTNLAKPSEEGVINPLQGDSILKDINSRLYSIFNEVTDAGFMEELGLSIDKGVENASQMTGKITFDESKFTSLINENPTKVSNVIKSISESMSSVIMSTWTSSVSGILSSKITGYDAEIKYVDERLDRLDRQLQMKESRLKQQFTSMEVLLSSMNSTQNWLNSQLEMLTKSNK